MTQSRGSSVAVSRLLTHCCFCLCLVASVAGYSLTILHTNDVHARFEQFNKYGSDCSQGDSDDGKCFGGVARRYTKVQEIRGNHDNVLLLDAGDQFMGTMWFTIYEGKSTSYFMNRLQYDVMCLGNHEFDLGIEPLEVFLNNVTFDVLSANLDVSNEPRLRGNVAKYTTKTLNGETIGIIGYITEETFKISKPGPTVRFNDVVDAVTQQVAVLKSSGVNKIIAVGHAGINIDRQVAAIDDVDLVIGGHSNTFLYNGDQPSGETIQGPYPIVVSQPGGGQGLIVQDYTWGKYLGYLNLTFDQAGTVTAYSGNPILLDKDTPEDTDILQSLAEWSVKVDELSVQTVGFSKVLLDGRREVCRMRECNLGNLVTDAMLNFHVNFSHPSTQWAPAAIALWNSGGIRGSIDKGVVTIGEILTVLPFRNEIDLVTVTGRNLREQLEHSVADWIPEDPSGQFLQMSGIRVIYDLSMPIGQRVVMAEVRCLKCDVPSYTRLDDNQKYNVFVSTFLLGGGDGYNFVTSSRQSFNTLDSETLRHYIKTYSPVYAYVEGRIKFGSASVSSSSTTNRLSVIFLLFLSFVTASCM